MRAGSDGVEAGRGRGDRGGGEEGGVGFGGWVDWRRVQVWKREWVGGGNGCGLRGRGSTVLQVQYYMLNTMQYHSAVLQWIATVQCHSAVLQYSRAVL